MNISDIVNWLMIAAAAATIASGVAAFRLASERKRLRAQRDEALVDPFPLRSVSVADIERFLLVQNCAFTPTGQNFAELGRQSLAFTEISRMHALYLKWYMLRQEDPAGSTEFAEAVRLLLRSNSVSMLSVRPLLSARRLVWEPTCKPNAISRTREAADERSSLPAAMLQSIARERNEPNLAQLVL
jgi:hypothetical protein